jgi:hypothetical protein
MIDLKSLTVGEILKLQADSLNELVSRNVLRSANKPTGDLAEYLFCNAFGWTISNNSQNGYDALCKDGFRYQIKARQLVKNNHGERMLSAIRDLEKQKFDFLAGLLFNKDYTIYKAAIIPYAVIVESNPSYAKHDNKHIFYLRDSVWQLPTVKDVTKELEEASNKL